MRLQVRPRHEPLAHHVVQRTREPAAALRDSDDFNACLERITRIRHELQLRLLAYCLMPAQLQLIVATDDRRVDAGVLARHLAPAMPKRGSVAGAIVVRQNPIDSEEALLACTRFVELCPVRAGLARRAELYPWSSARARLGLEHVAALDSNPAIDALGDTEMARQQQYRALLGSPLYDVHPARVRRA